MSMKLKSILFGGACGLAATESFAGKPTFLRFDMSPYGEKDWRNVYNKGKPIGKQIMPVPLWAYEKDGKTHFAEFRIVKKWEGNGEDCYRMYVYCDASIEQKGGCVGFRAKKTDDGILNIEGVFTMKYDNAGKRETLSREEGERAFKLGMQRNCGTRDAKKVIGSVFIDGKPMAKNNDRLSVDFGSCPVVALFNVSVLTAKRRKNGSFRSLSVLPPDDVRRKHNIQPFPTLGVCFMG